MEQIRDQNDPCQVVPRVVSLIHFNCTGCCQLVKQTIIDKLGLKMLCMASVGKHSETVRYNLLVAIQYNE